jgi:uncharacterized iron-regulated membrane protein
VRNLLLKLHLWTSLAAAVPLLLVGITGAILVYGEEIDAWLDPHLFYVAEGPRRLPAQSLLDRVRAAFPDEHVLGCAPPTSPDRSFSFNTRSRNYVYVDPYSGGILGVKHLEAGFRRKMFLLHSRLMAGEIGHQIVMISTLISVFLVVTGLVLWWKLKIVGIRWRASWWRVNFDLHSVLGFYSAAVLLVLSLTGVLIGYEGVAYPAILRLSAAPPVAPPPQSTPADAAAPPSLDDVIDAASRAVPGAQMTFVGLPQKPTDVYTVYAKFEEDPAAFGRSRIFVDRYSGRVVSVRSTRAAHWGTYLVGIIEPIHFGDIFGAPTRILACLVSLLVAGQIATGVVIWWKRK